MTKTVGGQVNYYMHLGFIAIASPGNWMLPHIELRIARKAFEPKWGSANAGVLLLPLAH